MTIEESDVDFESGYSPAEQPVEVLEDKQAEVVEQPAEVAVEQAKPDPIAEMRELVAKQNELLEKSNQRLRNVEGHIGGLTHNQKLLQETLAASKAATQQVSDAPTQAQVKEAMANPKEWEDLKADFPEWATATEKFMESKLSNRGSSVDIDALRRQWEERAERAEKRAVEVEQKLINTTLNDILPKWKTEVNKPEFGSWVATQPEDVKALAASDDIDDAKQMLKLYVASKSKPIKEVIKESPRKKLIEAAVTPKGTGGFSPSKSDLDEFETGYQSR